MGFFSDFGPNQLLNSLQATCPRTMYSSLILWSNMYSGFLTSGPVLVSFSACTTTDSSGVLKVAEMHVEPFLMHCCAGTWYSDSHWDTGTAVKWSWEIQGVVMRTIRIPTHPSKDTAELAPWLSLRTHGTWVGSLRESRSVFVLIYTAFVPNTKHTCS